MAKWIGCPWCEFRFVAFPPGLATVTDDGLSSKRTCPTCFGKMLVLWSADRETIREVRPAPALKLRWEPTFNGPVHGKH